MNHRWVPVIGSLILALLAGGCATAGGGAKKPSLPPAGMISRATFDPTNYGLRNLVSADIKYEVVVRPDGSPDLGTFTMYGSGSSELRNAILEWITASTFQPSKVNGRPVTSLHRGSLQISRR